MPDHAADFPIGAAATLAGLPTSTIRTWERRYRLVTPQRTASGERRYSLEDIERLRLARQLSECGDSLAAMATLSTNDLRERAQEHGIELVEATVRPSRSRPLRVAILHRLLGRYPPTEADALEVVAAATTEAELLEQLREVGSTDVLVLEHDVKNDAATVVRQGEATGAAQIWVVFDFASQRELSALEQAGARLIHGPLSHTQLQRLLLELAVPRRPTPSLTDDAAPPRRFGDLQLSRLQAIQSNVDCECPQHLAQIVSSLVAFEQYSAGCQSRSPADAELHQTLYRITAQARALMETALLDVCETEGLTV